MRRRWSRRTRCQPRQARTSRRWADECTSRGATPGSSRIWWEIPVSAFRASTRSTTTFRVASPSLPLPVLKFCFAPYRLRGTLSHSDGFRLELLLKSLGFYLKDFGLNLRFWEVLVGCRTSQKRASTVSPKPWC